MSENNTDIELDDGAVKEMRLPTDRRWRWRAEGERVALGDLRALCDLSTGAVEGWSLALDFEVGHKVTADGPGWVVAIGPRLSNVNRNGTLAQGRVEVLAEDPAGGHAIGAPATREEERALAREVLRFRALSAGAQAMGIQWVEPAPSSPADPPLVAIPWLVRRADLDPPGRWYGVPAESSADAAEIFAAEWCGPALSPQIDRQWEVAVEVADSPKGPVHRYFVRCEMRIRCIASRA